MWGRTNSKPLKTKTMTTPKDKAVELVAMFQCAIETPLIRGLKFDDAKQCALIAVDEIMYNNLMEYPQHSMIYSPHKNDYWNQVKEEINKL